MSAAHIVRGAALAVRAFGLHQGEFFPGSSSTCAPQAAHWQSVLECRAGLPPPMCSIGLLRFAATGTAAYDYENNRPELEAAFDALAREILPAQEELEAKSCDVIVAWSDMTKRTADEVAAMLDRAANHLDQLDTID